MSSFTAHVALSSGADRGSERLFSSTEVDLEKKFAASSADAHGLFSLNLKNEDTVKYFRFRRLTAIPENVSATIHVGPRSLGTVMDIIAFWAPSDMVFHTYADVANTLPINRWTVGGAFAVPPNGLSIPMNTDLPLWSPHTTVHPVFYLAVTHHTVTDGPKTSAGHYLRVEVAGAIHYYGGF
jgi:hypothetical protein